MAIEVEQPESLEDGGSFLEKAGTYHLVVTAADEMPTNKDGALLSASKFTLAVLDGTNKDQKEKTFDLMLWNPKKGDTSDMPKKRQTKFFLAIGLIGQHKPGERVVIDASDAVGHQLSRSLRIGKRRTKQLESGRTPTDWMFTSPISGMSMIR